MVKPGGPVTKNECVPVSRSSIDTWSFHDISPLLYEAMRCIHIYTISARNKSRSRDERKGVVRLSLQLGDLQFCRRRL